MLIVLLRMYHCLCAFWHTQVLTKIDWLIVALVRASFFKKPITLRRSQIVSGWNLAGLFFKWNTHRLTESDFCYYVILSRWRPWRHFMEKSAAIWWVHTQRPSAHCICSVRRLSAILSDPYRTYNKVSVRHGHSQRSLISDCSRKRERERERALYGLCYAYMLCYMLL